MPRVSHGAAGGDGGIVVAGVYEQLLKRERRQHEHGIISADPDDHSQGRFVRQRFLLDALEARKVVVVRRSSVRLAMNYLFGGKQRLPWDRSVDTVRVSPDDVVSPSDEECPWYGRAADDPCTGRVVDPDQTAPRVNVGGHYSRISIRDAPLTRVPSWADGRVRGRGRTPRRPGRLESAARTCTDGQPIRFAVDTG
jgi:hypothetical protein